AELNQKIITKMIRRQSSYSDEKDNPDIMDPEVLSGEKPREYIVYDMIERRIDPIGNERHHYRPNLGTYSIPIPRYEIRKTPEGYEERKAVGVMGERLGYSILFSKEAVDKLRKDGCTSEDPKELAKQETKRQQAATKAKAAISVRGENEQTHYMVQKDGEQIKRPVQSYKDWRDGTFEELYWFGRANVNKEDWERLKAINDVVAAAKNQGSDILDKINDALNKNKTGEELYK
ncbi:MAG: hypothetical protein ACRD8Z_00590, partial [Nitrososphaeraceae archaeon]